MTSASFSGSDPTRAFRINKLAPSQYRELVKSSTLTLPFTRLILREFFSVLSISLTWAMSSSSYWDET
jgi:hypothetical protein